MSRGGLSGLGSELEQGSGEDSGCGSGSVETLRWGRAWGIGAATDEEPRVTPGNAQRRGGERGEGKERVFG